MRIIDLDERADQPFHSRDGSTSLIFNGEIYNHNELRSELAQRGVQFDTSSDTEVIIRLFEDLRGDVGRLLSKLRGIFAFALFDASCDRLVLARDRLGVKPLYYSCTDAGLSFASEVLALTRSGLADKTLDRSGIEQFLQWGTIRGPRTIFAGIQELEPASWIAWQPGQLSVHTYWRPAVYQADAQPRPDLRSDLDEAIRLQLVADREVGIFLSSGVDSSVVANVASRHADIRTLTVATGGRGTADESKEAEQFAASIGARHRTVHLPEGAVRDRLSSIVASMDQPTIDGVNSWLICEAARQEGLVVVLSGIGGDELFGGYPSFALVPSMLRVARLLRTVPSSVRRTIAKAAATREPGGRAARALDADASIPGAYGAVRQLFSAAELGVGGSLPCSTRFEHPASTADWVTLLELTNYLPNQLLRDADQMSMAHSLELRVPLLDDAFVAAALSVPSDDRLRPGKSALLEAGGLGQSFTKKPFTLPFDYWLRHELNAVAQETILTTTPVVDNLVPQSFRSNVWRGFQQGRVHWSRAWTFVILGLWLDHNAPGV